MKFLILSLYCITFFSLKSLAHGNYFGYARERGVIISVDVDNKKVANGQIVKFSGVIKAFGKGSNHKYGKHGYNLLQEFKNEGMDIIANFPSEATDITSGLTLTSTKNDEIKFSYQSNTISAGDLNQFSIKVFNNKKDREKITRLSQIKAKLERRLLLLQELKHKAHYEKWSERAIDLIESKIAFLNNLIQKIYGGINSNEDLIAENTYALQVDNLKSNTSQISTVMNKYRFVITSQLGTAIEGMTTKIKAVVTNLRKANEPDEDDSEEKKSAQFKFNGQTLFTSPAQALNGGESISYEYTTQGLKPIDANEFSVALYDVKYNKLKNRVGWLSQDIIVLEDNTTPIWLLSDSSPQNQNIIYAQNFPAVSLKAADSFGRINEASFKSILSANSNNQDVSAQFTKTKINDGEQYLFQAQLASLPEGDYSLSSSVKDLGGNLAGPADYKLNFKIDRTAPEINFSFPQGELTKNLTTDILVNVQDLSPTVSEVFVNDELKFTSNETSFTTLVSLNLEGENKIKVVSTDLAGNKKVSAEKIVVRDTVAPLLSDLMPEEASVKSSLITQISGKSNEILKSVKVNNISLNVTDLNFTGTFVAENQGNIVLNFVAEDLAGNTTQVVRNFTIEDRLLNPALISMVPDSVSSSNLWVLGAPGAARKSAEIKISSGFFGLNSAETVADEKGSFAVKIEKFSEANLTAKDLTTGETASTILQNNVQNFISGIVKDTDNNPLANVMVSVAGTNFTTVTNEFGVFRLETQATGDQILEIDGAGVPNSSQGVNKKFTKTKVAVNIGLGQNNVLELPIYLTPLYLDGTETQVLADAAVQIQSAHAHGVELSIPSGKAVFPDGSKSGIINMVTIASDKTTTPVPENFIPGNVVSLEPSGTKFTSPVQLKLPNDNELPAKTPMLILSMNSSTGKWEIDGYAKVSDDAQSVVTNADSGISHFSLVYAVPLSPVIASIQNPNILGVDTTQGGLETRITPPSFKIFGQNISPALIYKSGWANPTAVVSKSFSVSDKIESNQGAGSGVGPRSYYQVQQEFCKEYVKYNLLIIKFYEKRCSTYWIDYFSDLSYTFNWQSNNLWVPDSVKSQFFVGKLSSDQVSISNAELDTTINQINGAPISNAMATQIINQTGIPKSSVVSYSVELKDKDSGEYLESGIYPSIVRFQIKLKNLTITTSSVTTKQEYRNVGAPRPLGTITNVLPPTTTIETSTLEYMPQDSSSRILVQNKRNSAAGSGWNISGVQKIYNPSNSTVMLEEANGSISTYSVNNVISTVFNGEEAKYDLKNRVDLSNWPKIYLTSKDEQKNSYLTEVDAGSNAAASNIKSLPIFSGELASQATFNCSTTTKCDIGGCYPYYHGNFYPNKYEYKTAFESGGWFKSGTGEFFILDKNQHSFYRQSGDLKLLGDTINVDDKFSSKVRYEGESFRFTTYLSTNQSETNVKCTQAFGQECGSPISQQGPISCSQLNLERTCTESSGMIQVITCNTTQNPKFLHTPSTGVMGKPGSDLQKLNTPSALISSASGLVYIADTGNNRIISYNASTGQSLLVAGTGQNLDAGDAGTALTASIYHPKALAIDANQNLYVASENGYIRKIDTSGIITTIAGKPLGSGGVISDESLATEMSFNNPSGLLFDNQNNFLYVSDTNNHRVMQINLSTGIANKVAGEGTCSALSDVGDGKPALFASLCSPTDLGFDENQNLVINDSGHKKIRRIIFSAFQSGAIAFATSTQNQSRLFKNADNTWSRQYRDSSYDSFNTDGLQVSSTNRLGQIKQFSYDSQKNLTKIIFPNSQEVVYNYSFGKLDTITDPAGRITSFEYQGNNLTKVVYPDNTTQQFEYNAKSMMVKNTNQEFKSTEFTYNEWNRLQTVKKPDGSIKTFNDIASQTISNNYVSESGTPMATVGFDGSSASTQVKDENQTITEMTQDHMGFISTVKDALGNITKITRDIYGKPILLTRADNSQIEYKYSETTGDLLSVKDITTGIETKMTYNSAGSILTYTDAKNNLTQYGYHPTTGQLTSEVMPDGVVKNFEYNAQGLVSKIVVTKGSETQQSVFSYNSLAQLISITDNGGKTISFVNDLAGNQTQVITTPNGSTQNITQYEFDKFNRIISTTNAKNQKTIYTFNKIGDILTVTSPKGLVNSYVYNDLSQVIQKTNSFGKSYFFEYDKVGNKTKETDPNNNVKTFEYDLLYRLKKAKLPDDEINLNYDSLGNLIKASSANSEIAFEIDSIGRITKTNSRGLGELLNYPSLDLNYSFDQNSNVSAISTALGNLGYSYDNKNRLTQISSSWATDINFNFDDLGRLSEINRNSNINSEFSFDASSNLQSIVHKLSSTNIDSTNLTYNSKNQVISKQDFFSQKQYTLDENSQLTQVQNTTTPSEGELFSYDENSNRLSDNENLNSTYDAQAQRLLEDDKFSYSYDSNGNLITKVAKNNTEASYNFIYNSKNQLVKAQNYVGSLSNLTSESDFQYDVIGRRIYKKVKDYNNLTDTAKTYARYFVYDRQNILAEYNAANSDLLSKYVNHPQEVDNVLSVTVTAAGVTAKLSKSSGVFYFLKDQLGSVSAITNASGLVVQRYKYTSFGKILSITDGSGADQSNDPYLNTTQTYTGREFDAEIKLYYYRARYYDASLGRFIQEDAYPGRLSQSVSVTNRYIYVFNNPQNYVDPSGNDGSSTYNPGVGSGSGGGYTSGGGSGGGGSNPSRGEAGYWSPGSSLPPSVGAVVNIDVSSSAHLANVVQYVSIFIPELRSANITSSYFPISSVYGNTILPTNTIWINSMHIPNGMPSGSDEGMAIQGQLWELLDTVHHEGTHYKEGTGGFFKSHLKPGHHKNIEDASSKFADEHIKFFLRIYYGYGR